MIRISWAARQLLSDVSPFMVYSWGTTIKTIFSSSQMPEHQGSVPWDYLADGGNLSGDSLQQDECLYFPQPCFSLYLRTEIENNLKMIGNPGWVSISGTGRSCLVRSTISYWASPVHGAAAMLNKGQHSPYFLNFLWWKGLGWAVCAKPF